MHNARLKESLIEYWFIIYMNVLIVPYYIVLKVSLQKTRLEIASTTEATRYKIEKRL